ncbi:hypothetical protein PG996_004711 [Apiospora saccharicola]|uniref:Uncharacterized protein n=1 Tax=Apiospora saccharicola TaxID=335842 RepID=A0ABR1W4U1_9PEZI
MPHQRHNTSIYHTAYSTAPPTSHAPAQNNNTPIIKVEGDQGEEKESFATLYARRLSNSTTIPPVTPKDAKPGAGRSRPSSSSSSSSSSASSASNCNGNSNGNSNGNGNQSDRVSAFVHYEEVGATELDGSKGDGILVRAISKDGTKYMFSLAKGYNMKGTR